MIGTKTIEGDYRVARSLLSEICAYLDVDESKLTIHMHQYAIIAIARQSAEIGASAIYAANAGEVAAAADIFKNSRRDSGISASALHTSLNDTR
jgi:hypothetical protein